MKENIISYTVNKVKDSHMYISVQNGEVVVNAPWFVTNDKIQKAIEEKRKWILEKIEEYKEQNKELMTLKPIVIFGIQYHLKIYYKNVKTIECNREKETIIINLPKKYKKTESELLTNIIIDKMYKQIAEKEVECIMEKTRILLGFAPEDYEIKEMKNEVAKCTEDKKIIINPRIVKYKKETLEYIILHQFCHLKYKNHTKKFYELIEKYMPNYKEYEIKNIKY